MRPNYWTNLYFNKITNRFTICEFTERLILIWRELPQNSQNLLQLWKPPVHTREAKFGRQKISPPAVEQVENFYIFLCKWVLNLRQRKDGETRCDTVLSEKYLCVQQQVHCLSLLAYVCHETLNDQNISSNMCLRVLPSYKYSIFITMY
jgi:hypothetical protein